MPGKKTRADYIKPSIMVIDGQEINANIFPDKRKNLFIAKQVRSNPEMKGLENSTKLGKKPLSKSQASLMCALFEPPRDVPAAIAPQADPAVAAMDDKAKLLWAMEQLQLRAKTVPPSKAVEEAKVKKSPLL